MNKIALITDTTADINDDEISRYNINVLPFRIIYKDREYSDKVNITPQQVYDNMVNEVPTSSMPSMQDMEDVFDKIEKEGYTHAIIITLSTGLSGIYNGVRVVSNNHPNIISYICDSKSISMGEGVIVEECAKLIEQGKEFQEIVDEIPSIMKKTHLYFVVPTLEYLKRGGRIGKVSGTIAELLDIKPIISPDSEGKYATCAKVRGRKQSLNKLVEMATEILDRKRCRVYIMHGAAEEDAIKIKKIVSNHKNVVSINFGGFISPVSGVHSGPGLVGIVLYEVE